MTSYGSTNARRSEATAAARRTGGVRNNAQRDASDRVQSFNNRANRIVADRVGREGANMTGLERQTLRRSLQRQQREGAARVRAAAESQSRRGQNETRSNTRNFTGTGRQAYQEPNRMDRRGGTSEAQYRARAGQVRTRRQGR
jgi:hypothetical protein